MPELGTRMHLTMLGSWERANKRGRLERLLSRLGIRPKRELYGMHWGDPETVPALQNVRDRFLTPYVSPTQTALEIGPGGGRWTRYLVDCEKVYLVEYHKELLDELKVHFRQPNLVHVLNNGNDFPGVPPRSVGFLFSFGTFVHLDLEIIDRYLANMRAVLRPGSQVVIQYSDKTKQQAKDNTGFSENTPERMRQLVLAHGYHVEEEELESLPHSSVIRFSDRATA